MNCFINQFSLIKCVCTVAYKSAEDNDDLCGIKNLGFNFWNVNDNVHIQNQKYKKKHDFVYEHI